MALEVTNLKRRFSFKRDGKMVPLPDPNPQFNVDEVMAFYSTQHPELTTATVSGPKIEGENQVFEFKTTVGTKG